MHSIKTVSVKNKTILVRVDFNVALDARNRITDSFRIKESLPTIEYLRKKGAKVILMSHLGRPQPDSLDHRKKFSLKFVARYVKNNFNLNAMFIEDCVGGKVESQVKRLKYGDVALLENLRFYKEEENNDLKFAEKLSRLADIYVNDAFGVSHRVHASVVGIVEFLPAYCGFLLEKEYKILSRLIHTPKKPAIAIIGGIKLETKLPLIQSLAKKYDYVLIGGRLGVELEKNPFGVYVSRSVSSHKGEGEVLIPSDYQDSRKLDIGKGTIQKFSEIIHKAKTIVWSGPMGMFENKRFGKGTKEIGTIIAKSDAFKVAGGGDTIAALNKYKLFDTMDFVSTGGGAMLEFLSGKKLAGIETLESASRNMFKKINFKQNKSVIVGQGGFTLILK